MAKTLQQLADYINTEPEIRNLINETVKYLQAAWPPEGASEVTVYQLKTILTDAQIKALPTTGITLVEAPGAGKIILPISAIAVLKNNGDYGNIDSTATFGMYFFNAGFEVLNQLKENIGAGVSGLFDSGENSFALLAQKQIIGEGENFGTSGDALANIENDSLYLYFLNGIAGDLTGGNAANTLEVTVFYSIVDL